MAPEPRESRGQVVHFTLITVIDRAMNITVWGINYSPEPTGIGPFNASLCEFLAQRGHRVEMVTGFEYYPNWKKKAEDSGCVYREERRAGVEIHRCWLYVPEKVCARNRILHELSFVMSSLWRILRLKRPDVFVVVSPPLLLGLAALAASFFKRTPFVFHIQDLQPDAAVRLGMLKANSLMTRVLYGMESLVYASATRVSSISPGILRMLRTKKVSDRKLLFFPNGVCLSERLRPTGAFRRRHGIAEDTFVVLYSGNLGVKQGLQGLIDAAHYLQGRVSGAGRIQFVIAGAGAMREVLAAQIERQNLGNVLLLPLQSEEAYREMMADADCCAITQQPGTGELFFPSKLLTTLALGKPVLAIADEESDLALAVAEGAFGLTVPPGSTAAVGAAVERLMRDRGALRQMGEGGREYVTRYEAGVVLEQFERDLKGVVDPGGSVASPELAASSVVIDP